MSDGEFSWTDYDCFLNQLEFYLDHGRRDFSYHDFFSKAFPSKKEFLKFVDIFKMAVTSCGWLIKSVRVLEDGGTLFIVGEREKE